ncbi:MAG: glyoxalase [Solirubrobacteraceae bacterium]|nr:glyoxalase [Solirubrobacteraceae bacterium]
MTSITSVTLEAPDPAAAESFYREAFGLGDQIAVRASDSPTTGFRGFSLSLVVSQPGNVDALIGAALDAGATALKEPKKSFWGYGAVVSAPDGAIWKVASSSKKDSGPATREIEDVVLLLGVEDVKASKRFYVDQGLTVDKSFGAKYAQFDAEPSAITLALYGRKALAKDCGVAPDGTGSARMVIGSDHAPFADPDGFTWQTASVSAAV